MPVPAASLAVADSLVSLIAGRISRFGDARLARPSFDIARAGIGLVDRT